MNYEDKLRSPEWREFRERVLSIKGYTCENCACHTDSPQVHHAGYMPGREPWEYKVEDMRVLCDRCHGIIHERRQEFRDLFRRLSWKNMQVLLRALAAFQTGPRRDGVLAHRIYSFLRDEKYRIAEENEKLSLEDRQEGIRFDVESVLLSFPEGVLDPILDGLDHIQELSEIDKSEAFRNLFDFIKREQTEDERRMANQRRQGTLTRPCCVAFG